MWSEEDQKRHRCNTCKVKKCEEKGKELTSWSQLIIECSNYKEK